MLTIKAHEREGSSPGQMGTDPGLEGKEDAGVCGVTRLLSVSSLCVATG